MNVFTNLFLITIIFFLQGVLGDDDSIYMSLGEIPISMLKIFSHALEFDITN